MLYEPNLPNVHCTPLLVGYTLPLLQWCTLGRFISSLGAFCSYILLALCCINDAMWWLVIGQAKYCFQWMSIVYNAMDTEKPTFFSRQVQFIYHVQLNVMHTMEILFMLCLNFVPRASIPYWTQYMLLAIVSKTVFAVHWKNWISNFHCGLLFIMDTIYSNYYIIGNIGGGDCI